MPNLLWGVDSVWPCTKEIHNARERLLAAPVTLPANFPIAPHSTMKLYDYVVAWATAFNRRDTRPAFWGRYLNRGESGLLDEEPGFLHSKGCRLVPIYNGPSVHRVTGYDNGRRAADAAAEAARTNHIPAGVRIYADLEGRNHDTEWFRGWCTSMYASPYPGFGGLYGDAATFGWGNRAARGAGDPRATAEGDHSKGSVLYLWTTKNHDYGDRALQPGTSLAPSNFLGLGPLATFHVETLLWQYHLNLKLGIPLTGRLAGTIDMDLATDRAYKDMW
jgi:hypothetical protein